MSDKSSTERIEGFLERFPGPKDSESLQENVELALESIQANSRRRTLVEMLSAKGIGLDRTPFSGFNQFERYLPRSQEHPLFEVGPYVTQAKFATRRVADDLVHGGGESFRDGPLVENRKLPRDESQRFLSRVRQGGLAGFWERLRKGYRYSVVREELIYTNGEKKQLPDGTIEFLGDTLTVIRRQVAGEAGEEISWLPVENPDLSFKNASLDQLDVYISDEEMKQLDNLASRYEREELERWLKQAGEVFDHIKAIDEELKEGKSIKEVVQSLQARRGGAPPPSI